MQAKRQSVPETDHCRQLIRRRTALEARLLAFRCGWLTSDEIKIRKLERELSRVLNSIGEDDPLARKLLGGWSGSEQRYRR